MKFKYYTFFIALVIFYSCKQTKQPQGKRIEINDSLTSNPQLEIFIAPYRTAINKNLDSSIAYAPKTYSKADGELNTAIGNFMADAVYGEAQPIFEKRTGKSIDFVLLNHGGIRALISKGAISKRTAYEVMPFENAIVVAALKGEKVLDMLNYLSRSKRAHPISKQLQITLNNDFSLHKALLHGNTIKESDTYYVATSDYLYNGGDQMTFFKPNDSLYTLDYKIRNALIDYFIQIDTLQPKIDNRFIRLD